jgi:2'-5' RNA ligase
MFALQGEIERICQRIGLPSDPRKFTPHVTLARLKSSRLDDVVHYLSGRGNFQTSLFTASRFVLLSSRESVGGGPYLTEEIFPLHEARTFPAAVSKELQPAKSMV